MEKFRPNNLFSRRQFLNKVMFATASVALISSCKKANYQIGCFTRPWGNVNYRVCLDGIAEAGYKYAGLMTHEGGRVIDQNTTIEIATEVGEEAKARGLEIIGVSGGMFDVRISISAGIAGLKRLIDNMVACGSPTLVLSGISVVELSDDYYKVIAECCDYAAERGVHIALKPHGGTNSTGAECSQRVKEVGHPNFTVWYDPGNIYHYSHGEVNPVEDVVDVADLVTGMCVKDFKLPRSVAVTPGTGMVDFPELFARLQQGGFTRGALVVEGLDSGDYDYVTAEARKAREYLEELTS